MTTVVKMLFGSHLYGLNHKDSDTDYKGVVLPTAKEILLQKANYQISSSTGDDDSKNGADDTDDTMFSLAKFVDMACKGETAVIDMLHAHEDNVILSSDIWEELVQKRHLFYTKNMKAYVGYVRKQAAKYGDKGSRLAVLKDAIIVIRDGSKVLGASVSLKSVSSELPIGDHSCLIKTDNQTHGPQEFYEICGRKFQLSNKLDYTIENLQKIYDAYGHRAQQAKNNGIAQWNHINEVISIIDGFKSNVIK